MNYKVALVLIAVTLTSGAFVRSAGAQTLGNPFGNPSKPGQPEKDYLNNDDNLDDERSNYCQTKVGVCYSAEGGFIGNPCVCTTGGHLDKGRYINKGQLN
jgi:hypothetical protein